ncbi:hypothetical protein MMC07_003606 [Pseudocyphellaria aurata]|nr:hypothetical protein [Pseudocyphellaria aurata]
MDSASNAFERYKLITERDGDLIIHQTRQPSGTKEIWRRQQGYFAEGGSGVVWLEVRQDESNQKRAVKEVKKTTGRDDLDRNRYRRELLALVKLSAPKFRDRFAEFYGWFQDETYICYAMEYFPLGDLDQYLANGIAEDAARRITHQLLIGLAIMHKNSFTHRDLKPKARPLDYTVSHVKNIFVVRKNQWWVKIGDFGISKHITGATGLHTDFGSPGYAAPELEGSDFGVRENFEYTNAVDMWSLGCVVHKMLTGEVPFSDRQLREFCHDKVSFPTGPLSAKGVSSSARDFVEALIRRIPSNRLDVQAALKSRWISATDPNELEDLLIDDIPHLPVPEPSIHPAKQILPLLGKTQLHQFLNAAAHGNNDAIKILRDQRIDINIKSAFGRTALHEAAFHGQSSTIELLLKFPGIEIDVRDDEGNTPFLKAACAAEFTSLSLLHDSGANPRAINHAGFCALHAAAKSSEAHWTRILLQESVPASLAENSNKMTPLHYAAVHGSVEIMDLLLDNDAELDLQDSSGWTALHYTARNNWKDCALLLLNKGSSLRTRDGKGCTPLSVSLLRNSTEVIDIFHGYLAESNFQEHILHSEFCDAVTHDHIDIARWLICNGFDVNRANQYHDRTPQDWIFQAGSLEFLKMLVEEGEGLDSSMLDKWKPIYYTGPLWGKYNKLKSYWQRISSLRLFLQELDDLVKLGKCVTSQCSQSNGSGDSARLTEVVSNLTRIICAWNCDMSKVHITEMRSLGLSGYPPEYVFSRKTRFSCRACADVLNDIKTNLEKETKFYSVSEDRNKIFNLRPQTRNKRACVSIERVINELRDLHAELSKSKMASKISDSFWGETKPADEAPEVTLSPNSSHPYHLDTAFSQSDDFSSSVSKAIYR